MDLLNEHRKALDLTAEALLEHETIDGIHVKEIIEFGEIRSQSLSVLSLRLRMHRMTRNLACQRS